MNDIDVSKAASIEECAIKCEGLTQMFAYGTNDFGANGCKDGLCKCHCIDALNNHTCRKIKYDEYWIFAFKERLGGKSRANVENFVKNSEISYTSYSDNRNAVIFFFT